MNWFLNGIAFRVAQRTAHFEAAFRNPDVVLEMSWAELKFAGLSEATLARNQQGTGGEVQKSLEESGRHFV